MMFRPRDRSMFPFLFGVLAFMIAFGVITGSAIMHSHRFKEFKGNINDCVLYCMHNDSLCAGAESRSGHVAWYTAEDIQQIVTDSGMGKPYRGAPPESADRVFLDFGNGSLLTFYDTDVRLTDGEYRPGVLVVFTEPDGSTYAYDTDMMSFSILRFTIRNALNSA